MKILKPNFLVRVEGFGRVWPEGPAVSNADIFRRSPDTQGKPERFLEELGERVARSFGFRTRYMTRKPWDAPDPSKEETSESLAAKAVAQALGKKYKPDAFILGTTTTRRYTGSQATSVLARHEIEAPAYEIKAGCSTSLASLHLAQALMSQGYDSVLVACAETLSKVVHPEVRETWFGLADAGAALALRRVRSAGHFKILRSVYSTDGRWVDMYTTPGDLPPTRAAIEAHGYALTGDGAKLKELAKQRYHQMIKGMLSAKERKSLRWIVAHQVNRQLVDEVIQEAGLGGELVWDAGEFGNVGGTSVLFSLARAIEEKRFRKNDTIFMMSVGGGLSFASQYWKKL